MRSKRKVTKSRKTKNKRKRTKHKLRGGSDSEGDIDGGDGDEVPEESELEIEEERQRKEETKQQRREEKKKRKQRKARLPAWLGEAGVAIIANENASRIKARERLDDVKEKGGRVYVVPETFSGHADQIKDETETELLSHEPLSGLQIIAVVAFILTVAAASTIGFTDVGGIHTYLAKLLK